MSTAQMTTPSEAVPAVDFIALLGRCLGNFKMVERVLAMFRETGLSDLSQLETAVNAEDYPTASEISHRFKGAASNVSATGLRELLVQAEQYGKEKNHAELTAVVTRLRNEWQNFVRFAEVFAPNGSASTANTTKPPHESSEKRYACAGC